jgi:hypothetical protein
MGTRHGKELGGKMKTTFADIYIKVRKAMDTEDMEEVMDFINDAVNDKLNWMSQKPPEEENKDE